MPQLRVSEARSGQQRSADSRGDGVPTPPLSDVPQDLYDDTDGLGDGRADGGGIGAGDPAFDFFRQDAERRGYVGPAGFAAYLKEYGILSPGRQRRIKEREITGLDLDAGDLDDRTSEWDQVEQQLLG